MLLYGLRPTAGTYAAMAEGYVKLGALDEALGAFQVRVTECGEWGMGRPIWVRMAVLRRIIDAACTWLSPWGRRFKHWERSRCMAMWGRGAVRAEHACLTGASFTGQGGTLAVL